MNKKYLLLTILICLPLTAFAQDATTQASPQCQTKEDIKLQYGEPHWQGGHKDISVWYYPQQRMFIFFDKGKVVRIDVVRGEKI